MYYSIFQIKCFEKKKMGIGQKIRVFQRANLEFAPYVMSSKLKLPCWKCGTLRTGRFGHRVMPAGRICNLLHKGANIAKRPL